MIFHCSSAGWLCSPGECWEGIEIICTDVKQQDILVDICEDLGGTQGIQHEGQS